MGMDGRMKPQADQQAYDTQSVSPPLFALGALRRPMVTLHDRKLTLAMNVLVVTGRRRKLRAHYLRDPSEGRSGRRTQGDLGRGYQTLGLSHILVLLGVIAAGDGCDIRDRIACSRYEQRRVRRQHHYDMSNVTIHHRFHSCPYSPASDCWHIF